ncbi:MAG: bifunctional DNA-formamidopyrimidine glycosylase/DNA-(apurinic or apyrimidinic site) lyase, partial [Acidobacteria bacterium]|nr:bifunctional DNA-formamidopyrimidine glycosylase/DNA-(apurinic or apyrimidinic site) lyase [Acidobacteriota bacterium]
MPELPEVETIVRGLRRTIPGRRILSVRLGKTDFIDDPAALERELPGKRIAAIDRHGKFILLKLSRKPSGVRSPKIGDAGDSAFIVHLGMTGHLSPRAVAEPLAPHTHVQLALDDGRELRYTDPRRFGRMLWLPATQ